MLLTAQAVRLHTSVGGLSLLCHQEITGVKRKPIGNLEEISSSCTLKASVVPYKWL